MPLLLRVISSALSVAGSSIVEEVPVKVLRGGRHHDEHRVSYSEDASAANSQGPLQGKLVHVEPGEIIDNVDLAAPAKTMASKLNWKSSDRSESSLMAAQALDPQWVPADVTRQSPCTVPPCYAAAYASPCVATQYAPCAVASSYENEALRATVGDLQGALRASQVSAYNSNLNRAIASGEAMSQTQELRQRLRDARQHLESEHVDRIDALDEAHDADMKLLRAELRRNATRESAAAYQRGFDARQSIDGQVVQYSTPAAIENSQRDTNAYQAGLAVGGLLAGSARSPPADVAPPSAGTFVPVAVER